MPNSLLNIGRSGIMASRAALDLTAQNIANASSEGYSRRIVEMREVGTVGSVDRESFASMGGVELGDFRRAGTPELRAEMRRSGSDLARAEAELGALQGAEFAVENAGIYPSIVEFEASLGQLAADPLDSARRTAVMEASRLVADSFNLADGELRAAAGGVQEAAQHGVDRLNQLSSDLAQINQQLTRTRGGTSGQALLLDQRDLVLSQMADQAAIHVSLSDNGVAQVRLGEAAGSNSGSGGAGSGGAGAAGGTGGGAASGPLLVSGDASGHVTMSIAANGGYSFAVDGAEALITSGSLAGHAQGARAIGERLAELDAAAQHFIALVNDAQSQGSALDGSTGGPILSGSHAGDIALAISDPAALATAPAGSGAASRDISNLNGLRDALGQNGPAADVDRLLLSLSSAINARGITRDALSAIADTAHTALASQAGVDLDEEAANLLRYQQAFQASSKVIQVAADLFDTIIGIR